MDAIRDAREVSQRRPRGELDPRGGAGPLHMKFSRDAAIPRIPAPHLLKQGQLQLAGASFRDKHYVEHIVKRRLLRNVGFAMLKGYDNGEQRRRKPKA